MAQLKTYRGGGQFEKMESNGSSMALNTQKGCGGMKPSETGNHNPGGTHPGRDGDETAVPIP